MTRHYQTYRVLLDLAAGLILAITLFVTPAHANCPPGDEFIQTGWYCWDDAIWGFLCDPVGYCQSACYPSECADVVAKAVSSRTTRVTRDPDGKLHVRRMVVHTEKRLNIVAPHIWIVVDPVTGKSVPVPMPAQQALRSQLAVVIELWESALAEQFPKTKAAK